MCCCCYGVQVLVLIVFASALVAFTLGTSYDKYDYGYGIYDDGFSSYGTVGLPTSRQNVLLRSSSGGSIRRRLYYTSQPRY